MKVRYGLLITMTDIMASNWSGGGSPPPPNGVPPLDRTGQPKNHELSPSGVPTPIYNKMEKILAFLVLRSDQVIRSPEL